MIQKQINTILNQYPSLEYDTEKKRIIGYLTICEKDNDRYLIEIDTSQFPKSFPKVWEGGERIPRTIARHIYSQNNTLCFTTRANEEILLRTKIKSLVDFIKLILIPYLENNSYYEIHKKYKFGEYEHNINIATYESYSDILNITSPLDILKTIDIVLSQKKLKPNEKCYCGSKIKIKKCTNHDICFKKLRVVSKKTLDNDKTTISNLWENFKNAVSHEIKEVVEKRLSSNI